MWRPSSTLRLIPAENDGRTDRIAVVGGVLCAACLWLMIIVGQNKNTELLTFLFLAFVAPALAALISVYLPSKRVVLAPLEASLTLALLTAAATVYAGTFGWPAVDRTLSVTLPVAAALLALAVFAVAKWRWRKQVAEIGLIASLVLIFVLFSPFDPAAPLGSRMIEYAAGLSHLLGWIIGALVFVALAVLLDRWEARHSGTNAARWAAVVALFIVLLFTISLYDDGQYTDFVHYMPFVGPALHARAGGIPLVDVYCQYGFLPWVLIYGTFARLPADFGTAGVVVRLVNIAYLLIIVLIAFSVARRRASAVMLMVPVLLTAITFHAGMYNLNSMPSTEGMRYLPVAIMTLVLCNDRGMAWTRWAAGTVLVVASFWSVESFLFTLLPWGGYLAIETLRLRRWRAGTIEVALCLAGIIAAHAVFALAVFTTTGRWIDYVPYFDLFMQFRLGVQSDWTLPVNSLNSWWIPVWLAIFLTLARAAAAALRGEARTSASRLTPIALYGIGAVSYFVGRSSETTLGLAFIPFALLLISGFQTLLEPAQRLTSLQKTASGLFPLFLVFIFIFGVERFTEPVTPLLGNSTVLRHCFTQEGCGPRVVAKRIWTAIHTTPATIDFADPRYWHFAANKTDANIRDLVDVLQTYSEKQQRMAILPDTEAGPYIGMLALAETGRWYQWPFNSPLNDGLSPKLSNRILSAVRVKDGEPLVVAKPESSLLKIERDILAKLRNSCRLAPVAETAYHSIYRLEDCRLD